MNWINIFAKGRSMRKKTFDFISKKEGPVYFEQACTYFEIIEIIVGRVDNPS